MAKVVQTNHGKVVPFDSGDVLDVINVGLNPNDIVFDGSNIWVVGEGAFATIPAR